VRYGDRPPRDRDDRRPPRDRDERPRRPREPEIPEDIEAGQLDKVLRSELLTLSKDNAEGVARHLVAVGRALDAEDLDEALAHAQAASRRAGRVAGVRETLGVVHYRRGEWNKALSEFRTARRISGMHHLLPLMADAERGLGRPERALELAATPEARRLAPAERIEMAIVVSGARGDLGQTAAAVQHLRDLALAGDPRAPWAARLRYAYAAALEADGQAEEARDWYARAAAVDTDEQTDVREILGLELEPELVDLLGDDADDQDQEVPRGHATGRDATGRDRTGGEQGGQDDTRGRRDHDA
jgi:tetratricopeptide (TPR) repeat protein